VRNRERGKGWDKKKQHREDTYPSKIRANRRSTKTERIRLPPCSAARRPGNQGKGEKTFDESLERHALIEGSAET